MSIEFPFVEHATDATPQQRFRPARVTSGQPFRWHRWATPAPAYWLCLVQIVGIEGPDQIRVQCFDRDGHLTGAPFDVNLADRDHAWRTAPSTLNPWPATMAGLGQDTCAVLCLTERLLRSASLFDIVPFVKYPYGEAAAEQENTNLRAALKALRAIVGQAAFDPILAQNGVPPM